MSDKGGEYREYHGYPFEVDWVDTGFEERHSLAFAGDGFLFPMLTMVPSPSPSNHRLAGTHP